VRGGESVTVVLLGVPDWSVLLEKFKQFHEGVGDYLAFCVAGYLFICRA
jgi:hypothetical protein